MREASCFPDEFDFFNGFSDLHRAPARLCDHGLLRQRVHVRSTAIPTRM